MNWLLIVVCVILLGNAIMGMKVGFIKTVFSLVSLILALILTVWISPVVKDYLKGNEKIHDGISQKIEKLIPLGEGDVAEKEQTSAIEKLKLPKSLKNGLIKNNNAKSYEALAVNSFKEYVADYLTGVVINAMAFILTFVVIIILLSVICIALDLISKLPFLNSMNKSAGLLVGLVQGLVIVWLFFILLTVFGSTSFGQKVLEMVGESEILSIIYNNNFLLQFITSATKILF